MENKQEGWREAIDVGFTDQYFEATQGYNDYRRNNIKLHVAQALKAREQEILREVTELQEKEIELYGTDKHGLSVEQLTAIINKHD